MQSINRETVDTVGYTQRDRLTMIRNHFSRLSAIKLLSICSAISLFCLTATGQDSHRTVLRGKVLNENAEPLLNARVDISTAAPKSGRPDYLKAVVLLDVWNKTASPSTG